MPHRIHNYDYAIIMIMSYNYDYAIINF